MIDKKKTPMKNVLYALRVPDFFDGRADLTVAELRAVISAADMRLFWTSYAGRYTIGERLHKILREGGLKTREEQVENDNDEEKDDYGNWLFDEWRAGLL